MRADPGAIATRQKYSAAKEMARTSALHVLD
jgi:hypothetical protein